jgi:predicted amidophosphoribosyltransferase
MLSDLLALLAPPCCLACRFPLPAPGLCAACRRALPWLADPCPRCALPRVGGGCEPCPASGMAFTRAWSPLAHEGPARDLVLALKLGGALAAVDVMGAQLAAGVPAGLLDAAVLVPVPAVRARRRRRGFDQAELIAGALGRRTGVPVDACLRRRDRRGRQVGRGRGERRTGIDVVAERAAAAPRAVLVDDVHTTGATLEACARALKERGAEWVGAATYVRTL